MFDLQGHRGARGLKPENTLPSFEAALDLGVTSVETDVHLTSDGVPVLMHEPQISPLLCRPVKERPSIAISDRPYVSSLSLTQLREYRADCNPDAKRFAQQTASVTPLAWQFAELHGIDPYTPPTLADLFAFTDAYAGAAGAAVGKTDEQRRRATLVRFDLELKRVPFYPALINDNYSGEGPSLLEERVVQAARAAQVVQRTIVRSFDHRCVRFLRQLEPALTGAVLTAYTAPVSPGDLARAAEAQVVCPGFEFVDAAQVKAAHAAGVRVVPWTVNEASEWARLVDWGVDGLTTDYPDRLAIWLRERGIEY